MTAFVQAQENSPGKKTLEVFPLGVERCYAQEFKPGKKGQLQSLMLYRLLRPNLAYESLDDDAKAMLTRDRALEYSVPVSVIARFNDVKADFVQSVSCTDFEGSIRCGVDCDGGGFTAAKSGNGLTASFREYGMVVRGGCGDEGEVTRMLENKHLPQPAKLTAKPLDACVAADRAATLSFARELISLRERVVTRGWTCLKRTYSKDHLTKNPKQKIQSVAVAIALRIEPAEGGGRNTLMDATASIKLKDGKRARQKLECYASAYEFSCGEEFRLKRRSDTTALLLQGAYAPPPGETVERKMLGLALGDGDDVFRLDASTGATCEAE